MKKLLILLTSVILSFTGCQKNDAVHQPQSNGGDENVTFTVALPDNMTKAVADNDGHGANVNHWIMEVRDVDGDVYNRQDHDAETGKLTHTFNVTLIKGQTYNVLFWADTKGFYNTDSLTNVKLPDPSGHAANCDSLDAFSHVEANFTTTTAATTNITLKRPFAQLNVIFTDIDTLYKTINDSTEFLKFKPTDFSAKAKVPTSFNVQTQTAGEPATTALNITATTDYKNNYNAHKTESTLFMDYLFATAGSKDIVDIDFSFVSKGVTIAHSFASIPFQRNYRTNIKGDLMSSNAQWNVEVDPVWDSKEDGSEDFVYEVVSDIAGANALIASDIASGKKVISVKFTSQPNDAGAPGDTTSGVVNKAIVTTDLPAEGTLNVLVEAQTKNLYIGDYSSPTDTTLITSGTNAALINVNVPDGSGIQKLVINAPSKTVYLNGALVASAGVIDCLDIITSNNTLVIEAGQTVKKLIFRQGALKIHGTVVEVAIPDGHGDIYVRDCEGLSQSVYDVLAPYIDAPAYEAVQDGDKWNIVKQQASSFVTMGANEYFKIEDAFKEVNSQEGDSVVITVHRDLNENMAADYTFTKNVLITTDNANGVSVDLNCAQTKSLIANAGKTLTVDTKVTITNLMQMFAGYGDADSKAVVKGQLNSQQIWAYKGGKFYIVPGAKVVCAYGDGMVKFRYDSEINVEDNVESAAAIDVTKDTPIFKSGYLDGDKDGAKVLNLKNSFTQTQWLSNSGNGSFTVNMDNAVLYTYDDGAYRGISFGADAAGNISMINGSRIISDGPVVINQGTVSIEAGSTITAKSFSCAGSININASNYTGGKLLVISATSASTYSNVTVTGDYATVVENNCLYIQGPVAKIGDTMYGSLEDALAAAKANDEIVLLADCSLSSQKTIDKNLSFDLNDKTISFTATGGRDVILSNDAAVSFKDGTLALAANANTLGLFDATSGALSLNNVSIKGNTSDLSGSKGCLIFNNGNGTVTLTECDGSSNFRIYRGQGTGSTLTVTGGTYTCEGYNVAFQDAGTATYTGVNITVNGAGTSDYQSGIYVNGKTAVINDCTVNSPNSKKGSITVCYEGSATINGGTYSGKYALDVLNSGGEIIVNGNSTVINCTDKNNDYGLYVDSRESGAVNVGTDAQIARIIINEGTVNGNIGTQHKGKVYVHGGTIKGSVKLTGEGNPIIADGGTFSFDPSSYVVTGYIAQVQGTTPETWKVVVDPMAGKVAKIGAVGYNTLQEAVNAVKANETITLLDNVTLSNSYTSDTPVAITKSGVVLDLNGKSITSSVSSSLKVKGTTSSSVNNVTIKNGSLNVPGVATARYAICAEYATGLKFKSVSMNGGANISYNSTAEFDDCTIYLDLSVAGSNYYAIYVQQGGSVTILDGNYTATNNGSVVNLQAGTNATIKGGTFFGNPVSPKNASQACYYLSGGSFQFQTDAYWPLNSNPAWIIIEEGYTCTKTQEKVNNVMYQFRTVSQSE